ncbi:MAG: hypothetical protein WCY26_12045 [Thiohalobacteraceae bacterium]
MTTKEPSNRLGGKLLGVSIATVIALGVSGGNTVLAGDLERRQAKRIHDRVAGVPPSAAVLDAMEQDIIDGNPFAAAQRAMDNSAFYNVTLKNFATPWTNRDQSAFAPLNDYTATVIGMIRDQVPFNTVLSADLVYVGTSDLGLPAYSMSNNNHYAALESQGHDLRTALMPAAQSVVTSLPADATAGVMTTRAAAEAFFVAGTNRAMFRFTLLNHLCNDLEQVSDVTRSPDRIRQDISRSPGGDSRLFLNSCVGCHSGMDPMAQAFAYYNFDTNLGRLLYNRAGELDPATGTRVMAKYLINADVFQYGFVTPDDRWDNYWRNGRNSLLGWNAALPGSGNGAKSLGQELANTEAFAQCQVKKVFKSVCLREPGDASDRAQVAFMTAAFKAGNYDMQRVFADAAVYCMGD